jgi:hypothetical protein
MNRRLIAIAGIVLACGLVFPGCLSKYGRTAFQAPAQSIPYAGEKPLQPAQIKDYQGRAEGESIPEWVNLFLAEGIRGVERLPEFWNKYVFVGLKEGSNFRALGQWEAAFNPAQDFAPLAAARIEARLITAAQSAIPDDTYGPFFETFVKNASDALYQGAVQESSFWIQQILPARETGEEGEEGEPAEVNREVYDFLVLVSIDRDQLEFQINGIFDAAKAHTTLKRDQAAAVNRIGENFFEGF